MTTPRMVRRRAWTALPNDPMQLVWSMMGMNQGCSRHDELLTEDFCVLSAGLNGTGFEEAIFLERVLGIIASHDPKVWPTPLLKSGGDHPVHPGALGPRQERPLVRGAARIVWRQREAGC